MKKLIAALVLGIVLSSLLTPFSFATSTTFGPIDVRANVDGALTLTIFMKKNDVEAESEMDKWTSVFETQKQCSGRN